MEDKAARIPEKGNLRIKPHENGEGYVVFNLDTSGLHFITNDLNSLLERIDGKTTIAELAAVFAAERNLSEQELLSSFIASMDALAERNIIKFL